MERGSLVCFSESGIEMSLSDVYSACIDFDLAIYQTYSYLKRSGYIIFRHVPQKRVVVCEPFLAQFQNFVKRKVYNLKYWLYGNSCINSSSYHTSFSEIFALIRSGLWIQEVPFQGYGHSSIDFDVYKPRPHFKKSNPGAPDYFVSVINTSTTPFVPRCAALSSLLDESNYGSSTILAIVDNGIVNFLQVKKSMLQDKFLR